MSSSSIDASDRQEIFDVLAQYATAIDRRDWELLRACFTDDCVADYADIYDDELVRGAEGWRIGRRRYTSVLLQMGVENDASP